MNKEITNGIVGSLIGILILVLFPFDSWLKGIVSFLPQCIITVIRITISILLLSYGVYKLYQWKIAKIKVSEIQNLENLALQIENKKILSEEATLKKKNIIYFPVVPTSKPNIIHLLFAFYVKKLLSFGLSVNIFVFDDYCMRKDKNNRANMDSDVTNFIHVFKKYIGNNNNRLKIIKESSFIKSNRKSRKVLISLLEKSSELKRGEIKQIQQGKPINENEAFSRYMKPLYNMSFLSLTSKKYGFTLSGLDEKPLWDCYNKNFNKESYNLCNLYIPTIDNTEARDTNNISHSANHDLILEKVESNFVNIDNIPINSNVSLFLKILTFGDNKCITYTDSNNNSISINNWDNLLQSIKKASDSDKENIYNSISISINNLINNKKNEQEIIFK